MEPGHFFLEHPVAYSLSIGGALAGAGGSAWAAAHAGGRRRLAAAALAAQCTLEAVGIVWVTEHARSHGSPGRGG